MPLVGSLLSFSRQQHEQLWLAAAGWFASGLRQRSRSIGRVGIIGDIPDPRTWAALTTAIDAIDAHALAVPTSYRDDSNPGEISAQMAAIDGLCDVVVVMGARPETPVDVPVILGPGAHGDLVGTEALLVRHILKGGSLHNLLIDVTGLPAPVQVSCSELAKVFGVTVATGPDYPLPSLGLAGAHAAMTGRILSPEESRPATAVSLNTQEIDPLTLAATWCAVLEFVAR